MTRVAIEKHELSLRGVLSEVLTSYSSEYQELDGRSPF